MLEEGRSVRLREIEEERSRGGDELAEYPRNVPFSEALFLFPSVVTNTLEFSTRARDSGRDGSTDTWKKKKNGEEGKTDATVKRG